MKRLTGNLLLGLLALSASGAEKPPPRKDEILNYNLTGPTGVSLGKAQLSAKKAANGWIFDLNMEAAVPGYRLLDRYHAASKSNLCALEFSRNTSHGARSNEEKTTFDYGESLASRETSNGGKSTSPIPACARDALSFLFYARGELEQGRLPGTQSVVAGASYQISFENGGAQPVKVGQKTEEADRMLISVKGPRSDFSFEIYFAHDKARTPLVVRCPFPLGTLSLELVR